VARRRASSPRGRTAAPPRRRLPALTRYGFHASHEQISPGGLLRAVKAAEAAGFELGMCSDHFAPWSSRQGHSGNAWAWLGSALQATSLELGVVTSPAPRYHPAIVAQAAATLADLHPGRFWLALGSGQLLNEHVTGEPWPSKDERTERLREAAETIGALLDGETVSRDGRVRVDRARLWSLPERRPAVLAAAVTPPTAERVAAWADGLITVNGPGGAHAEVLRAYREAGGAGRAVLQVHLSWAGDRDAAVDLAHDQWREAIFGSPAGWELALPEHFEEVAQFVRPEDVEDFVLCSADPGEHAEWLAAQAAHGFDDVMIHHVGQDQRPFIETFGEHVLPALRG
jgi:probable non-F420 flavinoid oxidoreductase